MSIISMTMYNLTGYNTGAFTLLGIPGLEQYQVWISIPFCLIYFVAIVGNSILLMAMEHSLHAPMFFFLSMLVITDLILSTTCVPKTLSIFWFGPQRISFPGCLTQLFFLHFSFVLDSSILMAMAFDRYVAICSPLRYNTILTPRTIVKIAVGISFRSFCVIFPCVFFVNRLPFCRTHNIPHTYCEHIGHMGVARLACGDTRPNVWYGLATTLLSPVLDLGLIGASYALILRAFCHLPSHGARRKALGTCGAHATVITLFYTPALFSFLAHRFGRRTVPSHVHILLANLYVVVPPALNPVVYGVRTQQIAQRLRRLFRLCWAGPVRAVGPERASRRVK
uniref:Olfactory receptor n=1 Tax=Moschus moschiferus TaxID=68415 RepID=A0A8C6FHD3_MOSMO